MPLTYAYRLHPTLKGQIQHVHVDLAELPRYLAEGWQDSPEKVREKAALDAAVALAEQTFSARVGREPAAAGPVHGETPARRGPGRPRKYA